MTYPLPVARLGELVFSGKLCVRPLVGLGQTILLAWLRLQTAGWIGPIGFAHTTHAFRSLVGLCQMVLVESKIGLTAWSGWIDGSWSRNLPGRPSV